MQTCLKSGITEATPVPPKSSSRRCIRGGSDFGGSAQYLRASGVEVLRRLAAAKVTTYRTDLSGVVSFYLDGQSVSPHLASLR
jgi:hypothetical protein